MKTIKIFSFFFLASLALTSCKKDDDGGEDPSANEGTLTASVDGNSFTSLEIATVANEVSANGNTTITIQGSDASGKGIILIINGFDGTGTYELRDDNVFIVANYVEANVSNPTATQTWTAPYQDSGVVGQIQISAKTATNIQGTFNFDAQNPNDSTIKNITNGSFNMDLVQN